MAELGRREQEVLLLLLLKGLSQVLVSLLPQCQLWRIGCLPCVRAALGGGNIGAKTARGERRAWALRGFEGFGGWAVGAEGIGHAG